MHPATRQLYRAIHRHVAVPVLTLALPTPCLACQEPLAVFQHLGICSKCWGAFTAARPPTCPTCALPRPPETDLLGPANGRCARCIVDPPAISAVRAAVIYDDHARSFLLGVKLRGHRELLGPLGLQVAAAAQLGGLAQGCRAVVPVPSHPWMTLRRGFRPAAALARTVARRNGIAIRSFVRVRWGARLVAKRLSRADRRHGAEGVFAVRARLTPDPVLLVDDVMTTGGTLEACARALRDAGACEVRAVVWARRLPRR